jgi:endonuclease/exonuclease/phosphatase family metal-dependent hydrolase
VPLQFYNTHLHTTATDRLMQTADIASVIDAAPAGPKVLVGDFNARPTAAEMVPSIRGSSTRGWKRERRARRGGRPATSGERHWD